MSEVPNPPRLIRAIADRLPDDAPRRAINGMSKIRIEASPYLTAHLALTSPEDRTWLTGLIAGMVAITDKGDGLGAEWFGSTEEGNKLDKEADRKFVIPQYGVLAAKGEIPRVHFGLKIAREFGMARLRAWGAKHGKSQRSRETGRQKTTFDMATIVAGHSPLSRNEDLMRWGAANGTALSLMSFFETVFDYMREDEPEEEEVTTARNSKAREATAGTFGKVARFIHQKAPWVTPSGITQGSKWLVESSAILAALKPDKPGLATTGYTLGSLGDGVDGAYAREIGEGGLGMIEDIEADLEQQIVVFAALSLIARRRGNKVAATNYALAAMTTPLSALTRAEAESNGHLVAEGGLGTRVGRGILAGVGMRFNMQRNLSDIVSATIAAGNINTVVERHDVVENGPESEYYVGANDDPDFKEEAVQRQEAILPYAKLGLAVGTVLLLENHSDFLLSAVTGRFGDDKTSASPEASAAPSTA